MKSHVENATAVQGTIKKQKQKKPSLYHDVTYIRLVCVHIFHSRAL